MKILITGSNGVLGTKLSKRFLGDSDVIGADLQDDSMIGLENYVRLDITKPDLVLDAFRTFRPDVCIHTAAYTAVDRAESERSIAELVNVAGSTNIAKACSEFAVKMVYISTDYIFDGQDGPYTEESTPNPISWYGETKYRGELALGGLEDALIARTTVLYGHESHLRSTFVSWLIGELRAGREVRIVDDQFSNPTLAEDMAEMLYLLVSEDKKGVYNTMGGEYLNRYEFSIMIARYFDLDESLITPISTASLGQPAPRPLKGGGDVSKIRSLGHDPLTILEQLNIISDQINI
jgi:dTDP-4-dehydrorhamnose reductase